jgi:hypothetical protein
MFIETIPHLLLFVVLMWCVGGRECEERCTWKNIPLILRSMKNFRTFSHHLFSDCRNRHYSD